MSWMETYELKDGITGDKREELNDLLCKPPDDVHLFYLWQ